MSTPRVSTVIPAYNAAATLPAAVESVLRQTFDVFEIVIVDDGSQDDTYEVANRIRDPRVRVLHQENLGASSARNTGISAAVGDLVAFLDADDLWYSQKLDRQLDFMARTQANASQTAVWFVADDMAPISRGPCRPSQDALLDVLLFRHLPGFSSTLVATRELLEQVGPFDESLEILEDWEFAIRLARQGQFLNLDEALTTYRVHPGNRSRDLQLHVRPGLQVLEELFADPQLPVRIQRERSRIYSTMFAMYSGGALKSGNRRESLRWGFRAIKQHPSALIRILGLPGRRMQRKASRLGGRHMSDRVPPPA